MYTGQRFSCVVFSFLFTIVVSNAYRVSSRNGESGNEIVSSLGSDAKTTVPTPVSADLELLINSNSTESDQTTETNVDVVERISEWTIFWKDDFDGPAGSLPSRENWIFDMGSSYPGGPPNWGNNELQKYTDHPDNVCVDGKGVLKITPLRDAKGVWTSARIETTRTDFKPPKNGKMAIEGRIHMPDVHGDAALGYWPAFWALGSPLRGHYHNWPQIGEFDIMENVNGIDSVWGVLHCGLKPNDPCKETSGLAHKRPCPNSTCQSDFHTYRFEWDDTQDIKELRWFVDGVQYHSVTSDMIDAASWDSMTSHSGYFILLNIAMGGAFPNALTHHKITPTETTEPGHPMLVDYVAVYTSNK